MKIAKTILISGLFILNCSSDSTIDTPSIEAKYFNQTPPGMTPKIFAPGILSTIYHEHSSPVYSPDGKEIFYTLAHKDGHRLMYMKLENGQWSIPKTAPFSGVKSDDKAHFSADGNRLYFGSNRPIEGLGEEENKLNPWEYRDWYVDKINGKWQVTPTTNLTGSKGQTLSGTKYINTLGDVSDPYSTGIYYQTFVDGKYSNPIKMNDDINSGQLKYFGFVAPDESYMMFYVFKRPDLPEETMGIFISFRNSNGIWGKAINMGDVINYPGASTRFPRVSPDGKYLFFNWQKPNDNTDHVLTEVEKSFEGNEPSLDNGDIYWISADIIEKIKLDNNQ